MNRYTWLGAAEPTLGACLLLGSGFKGEGAASGLATPAGGEAASELARHGATALIGIRSFRAASGIHGSCSASLRPAASMIRATSSGTA